jgi:hypothetical protein
MNSNNQIVCFIDLTFNELIIKEICNNFYINNILYLYSISKTSHKNLSDLYSKYKSEYLANIIYENVFSLYFHKHFMIKFNDDYNFHSRCFHLANMKLSHLPKEIDIETFNILSNIINNLSKLFQENFDSITEYNISRKVIKYINKYIIKKI